MKTLSLFCSLLMLVGLTSIDANAQYSRRDYGGGGNGDTYASNSSRRGYDNYDRRMSRRERQRVQARLESRAARLIDYAYELDVREARLDGRRTSRVQRPSRYRGPNRLLDQRELAEWDDRLDRRAVRLERRERDIQRQEARRGRRSNRGQANRGNRGNRRSTNNGGGTYCPSGW